MAGNQDIIEQIRGAGDLAALEKLRVAALGKSGTVTAQLKSLGAMTPEQRAADLLDDVLVARHVARL